jgi:hypothetical protein
MGIVMWNWSACDSQTDYTDENTTWLQTPAQTFPHLQAQPADTYTETATDSLGLSFWRLIFHRALFSSVVGGQEGEREAKTTLNVIFVFR